MFELERRLYRVDRFRLNPSGIPIRGVAYFAGIVLAVAGARTLPLIGPALAGVPWYLRYLALPLAVATLLTVVRIDGRTFHLAARAAWQGFAVGRRLAGLRPGAIDHAIWRPSQVLAIPDGSDPRLRCFRFRGPGAVMVRVPHELTSHAPGSVRARWRSVVNLGPPTGRSCAGGRIVRVHAGTTLAVHRAPASPGA